MPPTAPTHDSRLPATLLVLTLLALAWSAYHPFEWMTWLLEVFPALAGIVVLVWTRRRFPLTPLLYILIFLHALVLIVGGHYTYAHVPIGNYLRDHFNLSRNHYDRLGHFMQGLIPAIAAREVLLRNTPLTRGGWLFFLVASVCMAISAVYEIFEWIVAVVISGQTSDSFLGTQGDVWDTQEDMAFCLGGALFGLLVLRAFMTGSSGL